MGSPGVAAWIAYCGVLRIGGLRDGVPTTDVARADRCADSMCSRTRALGLRAVRRWHVLFGGGDNRHRPRVRGLQTRLEIVNHTRFGEDKTFRKALAMMKALQ